MLLVGPERVIPVGRGQNDHVTVKVRISPLLGRFRPAVVVGKADDVVLTEISAGLDFNDDQRQGAGVLQPVLGSRRNIGGLIFNVDANGFTVGDLGCTADDHPVLGTVVMQLEGQALTWIDRDTLHLEAFTHVQAFIAAPRTEYPRVQTAFGTAGGVELRYDVLDVLEGIARRDKYGVLGFNDGQIVDVKRGDKTA